MLHVFGVFYLYVKKYGVLEWQYLMYLQSQDNEDIPNPDII
jgi:hypothetical protein